MRTLSKSLLASALLVLAPVQLNAGLDITSDIPKSGGLRLVVMEAPGCTYCGLFRRDVLPSFESSKRAKEISVQFLDINNLEGAGLDLQRPVEIVPTFVLVQDKREIGRIPGYVGPENFFHAISYLISTMP